MSDCENVWLVQTDHLPFGFWPGEFSGANLLLTPHRGDQYQPELRVSYDQSRHQGVGEGLSFPTRWDGNFCRKLFTKDLKRGEALREWLILDTFFFVRILYMFIILIFWYSMMRSSTTTQRGVEFGWDGVAFENSWRELFGSLFFCAWSVWANISSLNQSHHLKW